MHQKAFEQAVRSYWAVRNAQAVKQAAAGRADTGLRGAVTGGTHLNPIGDVVAQVFLDAGFPQESIRRTASIELPGYYRPTKKWDLVVIDKGLLVGAIEFKSQVGPSFGNNVNNRAEEAIGNAVDIWRAYEEGIFGKIRPWLGYLFFLEEAPGSTKPVSLAKTPFPVDKIFAGTSYKDRYRILCQRLVLERLYDAACFVTSSKDHKFPIHQPDPELSFSHFEAAIIGRAAYIHALTD